LKIPIGSTGAYLQDIGAYIENNQGISRIDQLAQMAMQGSFRITMGPSFGPYSAFTVNGQGQVGMGDDRFSLKGTGKLFNVIETHSISASYNPPYRISAGGSYALTSLYEGSFDVGITEQSFSGNMKGRLGIPSGVPVVGGITLAEVGATIENLKFSGYASINITPEIKSICTPPWCPPQVCVPFWRCDWCRWWWVSYPCNCNWQNNCWQPPCIPQICTPYVPPVTVKFGFTFDANSGQISWANQAKLHSEWEIPYNQPLFINNDGSYGYMNLNAEAPDTAVMRFMSNWRQLSIVSTSPTAKQKTMNFSAQGEPITEFEISEDIPDVIFRVNYQNSNVTSVKMTLELPNGIILSSTEGALPMGFSQIRGFSRFNSDAREQVMLILDPKPGIYIVEIQNSGELGNFTVEALTRDEQPVGEITSIVEGEIEGVYIISWEKFDQEGSVLVDLYLDYDPDLQDGYYITTIQSDQSQGEYTLDTRYLNVQPGEYFVTLKFKDNTNTPVSISSYEMIVVIPENCPEPVYNLKYLPDDGKFHISWDPSESTNILGYEVLYTEEFEDLGEIKQSEFIPVEKGQTSATVSGLKNGVPLLVSVVAVGKDYLQSLLGEIVRIIPESFEEREPAIIVSLPDLDATVGYQYMYLPFFIDLDPAEFYEWQLLKGPLGMELNSGGIITWIPAIEQTGGHDVILGLNAKVEGNIVSSATQAFNLYVYPPEQMEGLEAHAYQIVSYPILDTPEGKPYQYQVLVHGPDNNVQFKLEYAPEGMTIGATSGLVLWDAPYGAKGDWVMINVIVGKEQYEIWHDYFLFAVQEKAYPFDRALVTPSPTSEIQTPTAFPTATVTSDPTITPSPATLTVTPTYPLSTPTPVPIVFPRTDINEDGIVDHEDLFLLIYDWKHGIKNH